MKSRLVAEWMRKRERFNGQVDGEGPLKGDVSQGQD